MGFVNACRSYRMPAPPLAPNLLIRKALARRRKAGATPKPTTQTRPPLSWMGFKNLPKEAQPYQPAPDLRRQAPPVRQPTEPPAQQAAPGGASPQPMDNQRMIPAAEHAEP